MRRLKSWALMGNSVGGREKDFANNHRKQLKPWPNDADLHSNEQLDVLILRDYDLKGHGIEAWKYPGKPSDSLLASLRLGTKHALDIPSRCWFTQVVHKKVCGAVNSMLT